MHDDRKTFHQTDGDHATACPDRRSWWEKCHPQLSQACVPAPAAGASSQVVEHLDQVEQGVAAPWTAPGRDRGVAARQRPEIDPTEELAEDKVGVDAAPGLVDAALRHVLVEVAPLVEVRDDLCVLAMYGGRAQPRGDA